MCKCFIELSTEEEDEDKEVNDVESMSKFDGEHAELGDKSADAFYFMDKNIQKFHYTKKITRSAEHFTFCST